MELQAYAILALAFSLIAVFFGILIAAVFELFRLVDYLLTPPWELSLGAGCRGHLPGDRSPG